MRAGGQEKGYRGGTENLQGILGFSAAVAHCAKTSTEAMEHMHKLCDGFEAFLHTHMKGVTIIGKGVRRLPNTSLFIVPSVTADRMLMALDLRGFALSSGSACSSGTVKDSAVLTAMGYPLEMRKNALRLSLGPQTTEEELSLLQEVLLECATPLRV
jgi:cysteine desulfurase